jgi:hypothetical protein
LSCGDGNRIKSLIFFDSGAIFYIQERERKGRKRRNEEIK